MEEETYQWFVGEWTDVNRKLDLFLHSDDHNYGDYSKILDIQVTACPSKDYRDGASIVEYSVFIRYISK